MESDELKEFQRDYDLAFNDLKGTLIGLAENSAFGTRKTFRKKDVTLLEGRFESFRHPLNPLSEGYRERDKVSAILGDIIDDLYTDVRSDRKLSDERFNALLGQELSRYSAEVLYSVIGFQDIWRTRYKAIKNKYKYYAFKKLLDALVMYLKKEQKPGT